MYIFTCQIPPCTGTALNAGPGAPAIPSLNPFAPITNALVMKVVAVGCNGCASLLAAIASFNTTYCPITTTG